MSPSADRSLDNFDRALAALEDAVALPVAEDRDIGGIIKAFELTYETAWKAPKVEYTTRFNRATGREFRDVQGGKGGGRGVDRIYPGQ